MAERSQVLRSYGQLVAGLWEDQSLVEALKADPHSVLSRYGFTIPADATINLVFRELSPQGSPDTQVNLLAQGEQTGVYDIIIPNKPADSDSSDLPLSEEVLELVAGGASGVDSCCCCPCCCFSIEAS